jgi:hypothetical protein
MARHKFESVIHTSALLVIAIFFIVFLNQDYPFVGHDYAYFLPRLLDTDMHYRINGLSIQWYTPSWGGGLPAFPNPQQIQFSLPQFLTLIINPWAAFVFSSITFLWIGYLATYFFITRIMKWRWQVGVLGALFFAVNGFYFEHTVVGHIGFQTFTLFPAIILALFSSSLPVTISAIAISIVMTGVIHQSGFYIFVVFVLSLTVTLPALYLLDTKIFKFKRLILILLLSSLFFIMLSGSKIYAVYSFMRFFPRQISDDYPITIFQGLLGMLRQYIGVMGITPLRLLRGQDVNALLRYYSIVFNTDYGVWEFDTSLTPILWVFLALGFLFNFLPKKHPLSGKVINPYRWIAGGLVIIAVWVVVEFTLAKGFLYPALKELPIVSSLHVNVRFASALIFPLAILGAYCSRTVMEKFKFLSKPFAFSTITALTLVPILFYFSFSKDLWKLNFNVEQSLQTYKSIKAGKISPVEKIVQERKNQDLLENSSNMSIYEAVFGYYLTDFHPEVVPGSVLKVRDGYFNMTNPSGFVFPKENNTRPFERIRSIDSTKLQDFINRRQPDWNRPLAQTVLDLMAGISAISFFIILAFYLLNRGMRFLARNSARK